LYDELVDQRGAEFVASVEVTDARSSWWMKNQANPLQPVTVDPIRVTPTVVTLQQSVLPAGGGLVDGQLP
jgi:hypothetical protein